MYVGSLLRCGDVWRPIDAPQLPGAKGEIAEPIAFFSPRMGTAAGPDAARALGMRKYVQLHALPEDVKRRVASSRPGLEPEFDGIAEVYDGDQPHAPNGCPWQAWSVSEVLRAWIEDTGG